MTNEIDVIVLKGFLRGDDIADVGSTIKVEEQHARELEANGLVERKKSPDPENKMAPKSKNKAKGK